MALICMVKKPFLFVIALAACGGSSGGAATSSDPTTPSASTPAPPPPPPPSTVDPQAPPPADAGSQPAKAFFVVFSAFPAESAPIVAKMNVTSTQVFNGKTFSIGTLDGVHVAVGLVGMGLANASATAKAALAGLSPAPTGVVFSGVAGSKVRIGDVVVPKTWQLKASATYTPDAKWLALAATLAPCFESCTDLPSTGTPVCMDHVPGLLVDGTGKSDETQVPVSCQAKGDDVFGCDVGAVQGAAKECKTAGTVPAALAAGADPLISDNETAAVAAEAAAKGLPFVAFRGVSDGASDPLGLPGYPAEFFAYYRLAARNAAAAAHAFVVAAAK